MQDVTSYVKASSPLSLAIPSDEAKKNGSEKGTSKSFISIMLAQLADAKVESKTTIKIAKETFAPAKAEVATTKEIKQEAKSIDEHLLADLLKVVDSLKNGTQISTFPTLKSNSNLDKILNNETALKELSEAKSLGEVIKLSQKYNLGLEKLSFSKESVEKLQTEFPKLTQSDFFQNLQDEVVETPTTKLENLTAPSINPLENQVKKTEVPLLSALKDLMSKETLEEPKITTPIQKVDIKTETIETKKTASSPVEIVVQKIITQTVDETKVDKKIKTEVTTTVQPKTDEIKEEMKAPSTRVSETKVEIPVSQKGVTETILQNIKPEKTLNTQVSNETLAIPQTNLLTSDEVESQSETIEIKPNTVEIKTVQKQDITIKQPSMSRESLNQFATDLREKIETYKPPIMKVELALSPKNLGEVDVTLLTRGNNLHVNISSNSNTMTLFTQNQAEFKNALVNMGFTNLEMNFSDQQKNGQQQNKNNTKNFDDEQEQTSIEALTTIEVVIPQYI